MERLLLEAQTVQNLSLKSEEGEGSVVASGAWEPLMVFFEGRESALPSMLMLEASAAGSGGGGGGGGRRRGSDMVTTEGSK